MTGTNKICRNHAPMMIQGLNHVQDDYFIIRHCVVSYRFRRQRSAVTRTPDG
jgi:hypothetical protein